MSNEELHQLISANAEAIKDLRAAVQAAIDLHNMNERRFIDMQRRIDDHTADIRELVLENQRILRYLEQRA